MRSEEQKTFERLAKVLGDMYVNPRRLFWTNLAIGVTRGIGATLGTAIVLSILGLILRALGVFDDVERWIESMNFS